MIRVVLTFILTHIFGTLLSSWGTSFDYAYESLYWYILISIMATYDHVYKLSLSFPFTLCLHNIIDIYWQFLSSNYTLDTLAVYVYTRNVFILMAFQTSKELLHRDFLSISMLDIFEEGISCCMFRLALLSASRDGLFVFSLSPTGRTISCKWEGEGVDVLMSMWHI